MTLSAATVRWVLSLKVKASRQLAVFFCCQGSVMLFWVGVGRVHGDSESEEMKAVFLSFVVGALRQPRLSYLVSTLSARSHVEYHCSPGHFEGFEHRFGEWLTFQLFTGLLSSASRSGVKVSPTEYLFIGTTCVFHQCQRLFQMAGLTFLGLIIGCSRPAATKEPVEQAASSNHSAIPPEEIVTFCGNCHRTPSPETFPKDAWYKEVKRGFDFYTDSGRSDLSIPGKSSVVAWYRDHAPERLAPITFLPEPTSGRRFELQPIPALSGVTPMVAEVVWDSSPWRTVPELRLSDMGTGHVRRIVFGQEIQSSEVFFGSHPACSVTTDLNGDGIPDLLIAELGSKEPGDHDKGALQYIPGTSIDSIKEEVTPICILNGVGRIAHVDVADFDDDGDKDLVVAEFGWQKTGGIWLLENVSPTEGNTPSTIHSESFRRHKIDSRHGAIHVRVCDLNSDGIDDFICLVSQEHETIDAYIGNGDLTFRHEVINAAEDPSFGSCGIELVDIDQDQDLDVVYCNGDNLDALLIKPYHGVSLLINDGHFPFRKVKILSFAGASDTASADFDGDGDMDIAVSGFIPSQLYDQLSSPEYDSLCWLEQTEPGLFIPHSIEKSKTGHLTVTAGDFNQDGQIDLAVGNYPGQHWGAVWWNRGASNSR